MPAFKGHNASIGVPRTRGPHAASSFAEIPPHFDERNFIISGVTKDSAGAPLSNCIVMLFNAATKVLVEQTTSDASGNYSFACDKTQTYFEVAYKAGAPDVAGTTVNNLTPV